MSTDSKKDGGAQETARRASARNLGKDKQTTGSPGAPPFTSPNRFAGLIDQGEEEEPWQCNMCEKFFEDPNAKVLECQRCQEHFCITCLKKGEAEYELLTKSDSMWFCTKCREIVEKSIVVDKEIEKRCKEIMLLYEDRVSNLEEEMDKKCDEATVRAIVKKELKPLMKEKEDLREEVRSMVQKEIQPIMMEKMSQEEIVKNIEQEVGKIHTQMGKSSNSEETSSVLSELALRKAKENNIVIHGFSEIDSKIGEDRKAHDTEKVRNLFNVCKVDKDLFKPSKIIRLGRFDKEKPARPILVQFETRDVKRQLFRNIKILREDESYKDIRVKNDMTRAEREEEFKLRQEARRLSEQDSGEHRFLVRGPPWGRKIVKEKV
jgi:hypothetical protein